MIEYRYSIRDNGTYYTDTEYFERMAECKTHLKIFLNSLYYRFNFSDNTSIEIDTLENNTITNTQILKGEEFIIS